MRISGARPPLIDDAAVPANAVAPASLFPGLRGVAVSLRRLLSRFGLLARQGQVGAHNGDSLGGQPAQVEPAAAPRIEEYFLVEEVDDAEHLVGDLFRRRFRTDSFPEAPRHFVAFARMPDRSLLSLGYVHYTMWEGCALCGGLVIDERHYRTLPSDMRSGIRQSGGVAELLLRQTFALLRDDTLAIWGHVGDKQSEVVCARVGFRRTPADYVMVVWNRPNVPEAEKSAWIERVVALGPF